MYETVTVPILIPCKRYESGGMACFLPGGPKTQLVRRFKRTDFDYARADELPKLADLIGNGQNDVRNTSGPINPIGQSAKLSQLAEAIREVRLVVAEWDNKLVPALYCPNEEAAVAVHILQRWVAIEGIAACRKCSKFYMQGRPDQVYCSSRCREAYRQASLRVRRKSQTARKR